MVDPAALAAFEAARPRLAALAYRMLGMVSDAEDVVQETYLRWHAADHDAVRSPDAWLMTACSRIAIDHLRRAKQERDAYVGPWLPEPLVVESSDPTTLAESVSMAFMMVMERLTPEERAAWLLHEAFDFAHAEVGQMLGKSSVAVRQLVSRGRRHLDAAKPRFAVDRAQAEALAAQFLGAVATGDLAALTQLLAADATLHSDGGGKVSAARHDVRSAEHVARFLIGVSSKMPADLTVRAVTLNGAPSVLLRAAGRSVGTMTLGLDQGRVITVYIVRNPDKLARLDQLA